MITINTYNSLKTELTNYLYPESPAASEALLDSMNKVNAIYVKFKTFRTECNGDNKQDRDNFKNFKKELIQKFQTFKKLNKTGLTGDEQIARNLCKQNLAELQKMKLSRSSLISWGDCAKIGVTEFFSNTASWIVTILTIDAICGA